MVKGVWVRALSYPPYTFHPHPKTRLTIQQGFPIFAALKIGYEVLYIIDKIPFTA